MKKTTMLKRGTVFVTFFGCCFGMTILSAALGTKFWFQAEARQKDINTNSTEFRTEASGFINFGLFEGVQVLNWGIGDRKESFDVSDLDTLETPLWIATIICTAVAILFALIGSIFALINTATNPAETINGIPGLYVWNGAAVAFSITGAVCWLIEFHLHLTRNVLSDLEKDGWSTESYESLGYSFWLILGGAAVHAINCVLVYVAMYEPELKTVYEEPDDKPGIVMLY